jgi:hypothetical protein
LQASHVSVGMTPSRISPLKILQPMQNAKIDSSLDLALIDPARRRQYTHYRGGGRLELRGLADRCL